MGQWQAGEDRAQYVASRMRFVWRLAALYAVAGLLFGVALAYLAVQQGIVVAWLGAGALWVGMGIALWVAITAWSQRVGVAGVVMLSVALGVVAVLVVVVGLSEVTITMVVLTVALAGAPILQRWFSGVLILVGVIVVAAAGLVLGLPGMPLVDLAALDATLVRLGTQVLALGILLGLGMVVRQAVQDQRQIERQRLADLAVDLQQALSQQMVLAQTQLGQVGKLAEVVEGVRRVSYDIQETVLDLSDRSAAMRAAMAEASGQVSRASEAIEAVRQLNETLVAQVHGIQLVSYDINSALKIVKDFASQTQLLALNARIEAAGAGTYGRRFGVVANQIKQLAEEALDATAEIRDLVERTRLQVEPAVRVASETATRAEESVTLAASYAALLRDVMEGVNENAAQAVQIRQVTEAQRTLGSDLLEAVAQVRRAMDDLTMQAQAVSGAAEQLTMLVWFEQE